MSDSRSPDDLKVHLETIRDADEARATAPEGETDEQRIQRSSAALPAALRAEVDTVYAERASYLTRPHPAICGDFGATLLTLGAMLIASCQATEGAVPSDPDGSGRGWVQSETSMARAVGPTGAPRLVLAYNDLTGVLDSGGNMRPDVSLLGLSISDDLGRTWTRRGQFAAGSAKFPTRSVIRGSPQPGGSCSTWG